MMAEGETAVAGSGVPGPPRRRPGDLAIAELLRAQARVPRRGRLARIVGASPLSEETTDLFRAVLGEVLVGEALDRLGPGWIVVHGIPQGEGLADIDHLVVGPPGVVLVCTRTHRGAQVWASQRTLMVGGVRQSAIRDLEFEMGRVERVLGADAGRPLQAVGVLAVVAASSVTVAEPHRDVAVLPAQDLVAWLHRAPRRLEPAEVARIGVLAARSATWSPLPAPVGADGSERERFDRLRAEVRAATRTQRVWVTVAAVLAVVALVSMTWTVVAETLGAAGM